MPLRALWRPRRARLLPQLAGDLERVETGVFPPQVFFTRAVEFAVMAAAERHREFVAHLAAECAALGEAHVVRVDGAPAADEAGLGGDKGEVCLVAEPARR